MVKEKEMTDGDHKLMLEFKRRLPAEASNHLRQIIVFGSRARGDAAKEADLDVIVLVDSKSPDLETQLEDAAYSVMWDHDFDPIISLKIFDESRFRKLADEGFSFYRNVEKDGIII